MVRNDDVTHPTLIPLQLLALSEATRTYIETLKASMAVATSLGERGAHLLDQMNAGLRGTEPGTPVAIAVALRDLIEP